MRIFLENKRKFLLLMLLFIALLIVCLLFFRINSIKEEEVHFEVPASEQKQHAFLLNISEEYFIDHFGQPEFIYKEDKHSMIQYRSDHCIMSVYFVRNKQNKNISKKVLFRLRQTLEYQESCKDNFNVTSFVHN